MEFIKRKDALKILKICYKTLYRLAEDGEIETVMIGKQMLYNVKKYLEEKNIVEKKDKENICYCRVSSRKQKEDLARQIQFMKERYPNYKIVSDIGSGLNYDKKGLREILSKAINGEINEVVVAYKDRLTRFGYELIEWLIKEYSNGKIIVISRDEEATPTEELTKDILTIMNVYVAKVNGLRKYKTKMVNMIDKK